jgi:adenylate dimethylallyltransferase (cytokinin synthase)
VLYNFCLTSRQPRLHACAYKSIPMLNSLARFLQHTSKQREEFRLHVRMERTVASKGKVVVVMGATATGKSKLAVDLALRFGGEVINSDKIQVHDGLDVVTNKVTPEERRGVRHHLIGGVRPDADYAAADFRRDAARAVESVLVRGRVPIVAGGSNRYLEALLDGGGFRQRYDCFFLWVDADEPVLRRYTSRRVDRMLEQGLVDEVRAFFRPDGDYSRGITRAIGVPEMHAYFRLEAVVALAGDARIRARVLAAAVSEIKANTCRLACRQREKIHRLRTLPGWSLRRLDVTKVLSLKVAGDVVDADAERAAWERDVAAFLEGKMADDGDYTDGDIGGFVVPPVTTKEGAVAGSGTAAEWRCLQLEKAVVARGRAFVEMEAVA